MHTPNVIFLACGVHQLFNLVYLHFIGNFAPKNFWFRHTFVVSSVWHQQRPEEASYLMWFLRYSKECEEHIQLIAECFSCRSAWLFLLGIIEFEFFLSWLSCSGRFCRDIRYGRRFLSFDFWGLFCRQGFAKASVEHFLFSVSWQFKDEPHTVCFNVCMFVEIMFI